MQITNTLSIIPGSTRGQILFLLKTHGPQTAEQMAKKLNVTTMAIRQHLSVLEKEALANSTDIRNKVGRPARLWELAPQAYYQFPDYHAEFAAGMIGAIESAFGEEGLEQLVKKRTQAQIQNYKSRITNPNASIEERMNLLTQIRCEEGYMAEWRRRQDGIIVFTENHCSIANVASLCLKLCGEELTLFQEVLGHGIHVERAEYLFGGGRCCTYHISEVKSI